MHYWILRKNPRRSQIEEKFSKFRNRAKNPLPFPSGTFLIESCASPCVFCLHIITSFSLHSFSFRSELIAEVAAVSWTPVTIKRDCLLGFECFGSWGFGLLRELCKTRSEVQSDFLNATGQVSYYLVINSIVLYDVFNTHLKYYTTNQILNNTICCINIPTFSSNSI